MELGHNGESSDELPIDGQNCLALYKNVYFKSWDQFENDDPNEAGLKKNYRLYDIEIPDAFIDSMPQVNTQLFLYQIEMSPILDTFNTNDETVKVFHNLLQTSQTYGILTRKKLPRMASMKFAQSCGQVTCSVSYEPTHITLDSPQKLDELKRFHLVLFRNVLNIWKDFFTCDSNDSVLIVPIKNNQINWNIVQKFQKWPEWKQKTASERENAVYREADWLHSVISPWYRTDSDDNIRYVVTNISDVRARSPFPNRKFRNYAAYTEERYPHIGRIIDSNQFMLCVKATTQNLNCISCEGQKKTRNCFTENLFPELCVNFEYPGDLWLKAIFLPSILHRITYILHAERLRVAINGYVGIEIIDYTPSPLIERMAKIENPQTQTQIVNNLDRNEIFIMTIQKLLEVGRYFDSVTEVDVNYLYKTIDELKTLNSNGNQSDDLRILDIKLSTPITDGVEQRDILTAITAISSADAFNMELFEILGDAFLKFSVSLYLIQNHSDWQEGPLTTIKSHIIGNRNLCYAAIRNRIPGLIKVQQFNPKYDWLPPMFNVVNHEQVRKFIEEKGENIETTTLQNFLGKQRISDKTCADCIEAIIGTCVKSIGIERSFKVLEMLGILPQRDELDISKMLHATYPSPRLHTDISDSEIDDFLVDYKKIEQSIGYTFNDRAFLLQALTHPSYPTNRVTDCYQQLEFLGDAVLDILISTYIFERCPQMGPGQLTDLRSALVNNVTLACLCVRNNIHNHILSHNAIFTESVNKFVNIQREFNHEVGDHLVIMMEEQNTAEYVDVPKSLGDVIEAIIGGIFRDSRNDLEATWKVIHCLMKKELDKFIQNVPKQLVRQLYEFPNANPKFDDPDINQEKGTVRVQLRFTCKGREVSVYGCSTNTKNAKQAAAKMALTRLKTDV